MKTHNHNSDLRNTETYSEIDHPLIERDITILRDKKSSLAEFRRAVSRVTTLLGYRALQDLKSTTHQVETPIITTEGTKLDQHIIIVPILRAGLGMVDPILHLVPEAKVGHLGMYRDEETNTPIDYYANLPKNLEQAMVLIVDPMLATGGSALDAVSFLKNHGANQLIFISLISAPEGLQKLSQEAPDVEIITAAVDDKLNEEAFIVPGLGDAGDRYFGTT